jgi:hypothetical protein
MNPTNTRRRIWGVLLKGNQFLLNMWHSSCYFCYKHRIGGIMVIVFASRAVDRGFEPWSGLTKDYIIGMCCFSAKHVSLRRKSKDWLARN